MGNQHGGRDQAIKQRADPPAKRRQPLPARRGGVDVQRRWTTRGEIGVGGKNLIAGEPLPPACMDLHQTRICLKRRPIQCNPRSLLRTAKRRDEDIGLLRKHLRHHLRLLRGLGDALIGQR